jgi:flagellar protein FliT
MNTIAQYESLSGLLTTMISAAEKGEWDQVAGMESNFKPIIDQIRSTSIEERLSDDERRQKIQVIKQILRDDARLRELANPWMAQLQDVMQQTRNGRDAIKAYDNR